jgi:hypothetical protein
LVDPAVVARLAQVDTIPTTILTPAEFGAYIAAEIEKSAKVEQFAGIKPLIFHKLRYVNNADVAHRSRAALRTRQAERPQHLPARKS